MRTVVLMSGVSGSGKSTMVEQRMMDYMSEYKIPMDDNALFEPVLRKGNPSADMVRLSTDDYFMEDGEYNFNANHIGIAHGMTLRHFINACQSDRGFIIVDNTNTTNEELAPYIATARAYGYRVEVVTIMCHDLGQVDKCFYRNTHSVPFPSIKRMAENLNRRISNIPAHWKFDAAIKFTNLEMM